MSCLLWFGSRFRRSRRPDVNPDNPEEEQENVRNGEAERPKTRSKRMKNWRMIFRKKKKRETEVEVEEEAGESSAEQGPSWVEHRDAAELLPAPAENEENPAGGEEATNSVPDGAEKVVDQRQDNEILKETDETEDQDVKELVNVQKVESKRITELTENTLNDLVASCSELEDKILKLMKKAEAAEARVMECNREEANAFAHEEYGGMLVMREEVGDINDIMVRSAGDRGLSSGEGLCRAVRPFWHDSSLLFPRHARRRDGI
ncbi:uncharacterized protein LOC134318994 isoform X2 [Trichomycterus rosablanca]|uniref:uncharacterized protein LOC134318994 isoform X2 n=1 Tax=Trichomycterus rosablanca TaxID=2290929 RepID=UPI002F35DA29